MKTEEKVNKLDEKKFKRLVGVNKNTFREMVFEFTNSIKAKREKFGIGGRKQKLSETTKVLLMLEYFREYRTLANIGFDYGVSESTASRTVKEVEDILIKSKKFHIPSKQDLGIEKDLIQIDVTEIAIERPKKNR